MELSNEFRVGVPVDQAWGVLTDLERIAPCMPGAQLQEIEGDEYRGIVKVKVGPITAQYKGAATMVERDDSTYRAVVRAEGREVRGQGNAAATITAQLTPQGDATQVQVKTDLSITGKVAQFGGRGVLADISAKLIGQFVEALERDVLSGPAPTRAPAPAPAAAKKQPAKKAPAKKQAAKKASGPASKPAAKPETTGSPAPTESAPSSPAKADAPAKPVGDAELAPAAERVPDPTPPAVRRVQQAEPQPVDLLDAAGAPLAKRLAPVLAALLVLLILRRLFRGDRDDD